MALSPLVAHVFPAAADIEPRDCDGDVGSAWRGERPVKGDTGRSRRKLPVSVHGAACGGGRRDSCPPLSTSRSGSQSLARREPVELRSVHLTDELELPDSAGCGTALLGIRKIAASCSTVRMGFT
jgi:hypothetical protein